MTKSAIYFELSVCVYSIGSMFKFKIVAFDFSCNPFSFRCPFYPILMLYPVYDRIFEIPHCRLCNDTARNRRAIHQNQELQLLRFFYEGYEVLLYVLRDKESICIDYFIPIFFQIVQSEPSFLKLIPRPVNHQCFSTHLIYI